ncbi:MAG: helical backbone metal receptor, partial [Betaproteobacteria bacterium]
AAFVPSVIVTHPMGPLENPPLYRLLGGIFRAEAEAERLAREFQSAYFEAVEATSRQPRERVLYLIWKDPWMTISRDTYIARTLQSVGWDQIDLENPGRYPTLYLESVAGRVDRVLLSSEPYAFRERDVGAVTEAMNVSSPVPGHAVASVTVSLIDAQMTSWYGSRAIEGMRYLASLRTASRP